MTEFETKLLAVLEKIAENTMNINDSLCEHWKTGDYHSMGSSTFEGVVPISDLVTTVNAAIACGVSTKTLRRYRDLEGGFLVKGIDWFEGVYDNSPIKWNINRCKEALSKKAK